MGGAEQQKGLSLLILDAWSSLGSQVVWESYMSLCVLTQTIYPRGY